MASRLVSSPTSSASRAIRAITSPVFLALARRPPPSWLAEWGSLDDVLEHADEIKGKMGERIREHAEDARISRAVATIRRDAPVELSLDDVQFPSFSAQEVSEAFGALHFNRHLRAVLALLGDDASTAAAMPEPKVKLSYHMARDAESFVKAAVKAGRRVAVALDEPAEQSLFAQEPLIVFSDGAGLAEATVDAAAPLIGHVLAEGTLVGIDVKHLLRKVFAPGHPAHELDTIFSAQLFDCSLAAYLLDSGGSYLTSELAEKYLDLVKPTGQDAPSDGRFEAAVAESLVDILAAKLKEDDSWNLYCDIEMRLMPVLLSMERFGVAIDHECPQGHLGRDIRAYRGAAVADYRIGGRGFQHRLAQAARAHPVRSARSGYEEVEEEPQRLVHERRRSREATRRPSAAG